MTVTETQLTPDDVVSRGKVLYENDLRVQVEEGDIGRLLMVDVTTGNWVMREDRNRDGTSPVCPEPAVAELWDAYWIRGGGEDLSGFADGDGMG